MKPDDSQLDIARQWLDYARSDFELAATRPGEGILPGTLCFLAQQACEKSLKALLVFNGVEFPRTHNINVLLQHLPDDIDIPSRVYEAAGLTEYAVSSRYPGVSEPVTLAEYDAAVATAKAVYEWVSDLIGYSSSEEK